MGRSALKRVSHCAKRYFLRFWVRAIVTAGFL